jgi:hypothetical protein
MVGKPGGFSTRKFCSSGRQALLHSEQAPATYFALSYRGRAVKSHPADESEEVRAQSEAIVLPRRVVGVGLPLAEDPAANPGRAIRRVEQIAARTHEGVARAVLVREPLSG